MTAMKRMKEIEKQLRRIEKDLRPGHDMDIYFLMKAFHVMREMVIEYADQSWHRGDKEELDKEFEERMAK